MVYSSERSHQSIILCSTFSFDTPYLSLETFIIFVLFESSRGTIGKRVLAEKALPATPSIISFRYILYLVRLTISLAKKWGINSFSKNSASSAPTLKETIVPTFPKTASLTSSSI